MLAGATLVIEKARYLFMLETVSITTEKANEASAKS